MIEYSDANLLTHGVSFAWTFRASIVRVCLDKLESSFTDSIFTQGSRWRSQRWRRPLQSRTPLSITEHCWISVLLRCFPSTKHDYAYCPHVRVLSNHIITNLCQLAQISIIRKHPENVFNPEFVSSMFPPNSGNSHLWYQGWFNCNYQDRTGDHRFVMNTFPSFYALRWH
jgi:hypothetical protein